MAGSKVDIMWSTSNTNHFIVAGSELSLYSFEPFNKAYEEKLDQSYGKNSVSKPIRVSTLSTNRNIQFLKCFALCPNPILENIIAVGLTNGHIFFTGFHTKHQNNTHDIFGTELVPKTERLCNFISWNKTKTNILAAGMDKHKTDLSILIWDIRHKPSNESSSSPDRRCLQDLHKPYLELGDYCSTVSIDWFQADVLIAGMSKKHLKIFDLRDPKKHQQKADTEAIYGIQVDPHSSNNRIVSYYEKHVSVWDRRNFEKPVLTLRENKAISKAIWSPTRTGYLAVLSKESSFIKLYDIQHSLGDEDIEPAWIESTIKYKKSSYKSVLSMAWHPVQPNKLLTLYHPFEAINLTIHEKISVDWSPHNEIVQSQGKELTTFDSSFIESDMSFVMYKRVKEGYGIKFSRFSDNCRFIEKNTPLFRLWKWLDLSQAWYNEKSLMKSPQNSTLSILSTLPYKGSSHQKKFIGVQQILCAEKEEQSESLESSCDWYGAQTDPRLATHRTLYRSSERYEALELCGWNFTQDISLFEKALTKMLTEEQFERAAAIALFNLHLGKAIEILNSGARHRESGVNLNMVVMALSGYTNEKNSLWKEKCSNLCKDLDDPYLTAMFCFLTSENFQTDVLTNSSMLISDQVAFACLYLSDEKLCEFISKKSKSLIESGNLDGILITGLSLSGISLLSEYVDQKSDIQTACLVIIQALPNSDISTNKLVQIWLENYRELLDRWKLWKERAEFDIYKNSIDCGNKQIAQAFVSCNFCRKPISINTQSFRRQLSNYTGMDNQKTKIISCPNCRKPLPRCSICLLNLGTVSSGFDDRLSISEHTVADNMPPPLISDESEWFTWCQTCRHGGHAHHIENWFKKHQECPVNGCTCPCMVLDQIRSLQTECYSLRVP